MAYHNKYVNNIDNLLSLFPEPHIKTNGGYNVRCPAHDDRTPSLSLSIKENRILFFCHAGCETESILDALGLTKADLFLDGGTNHKKVEIARRYHLYYDENGALIYRHVIISFSDGTKTGPFDRYENGKWISKLEGRPQTLYNLMGLKTPGPVYLSESEKDADALISLGFIGSSFGGSSNWKPYLADLLSERDVIILEHNDDAGRDATRKAVPDLKAKGCIVKVIPGETWGKKKGSDVADWLEVGHGKEELLELVNSTPGWEPGAVEIAASQDTTNILVLGSDLRQIECVVEWLFDKLIPEKSITLLSGRGGIGKTWLTIGIADAISKGFDLFGQKTKKVPVYYIDFENSLPILIERIRKVNADDVYFWHSSNEVKPPRVDGKEWDLYKELEPGLIVFDTLRACQGKDENNSQDMAFVMGRLKELRDMGFTVLLLHHTPKGNDRQYKGSTAIFDLSDHVLGLYKVKKGGKPDEEVDEDDDNEDAIFRFGTKDKTRYAPYHIHITFDPEKGFILAPDPDESAMEVLKGIIQADQGMNQGQVFDAVKEILGIKKKEKVTYLLKKGEGNFWRSIRDKNKILYFPIKELSLCPPLYIGDNGTVLENRPEICPESPENQNPQSLINAELSHCPDMSGTEGTDRKRTVPGVEAEGHVSGTDLRPEWYRSLNEQAERRNVPMINLNLFPSQDNRGL